MLLGFSYTLKKVIDCAWLHKSGAYLSGSKIQFLHLYASKFPTTIYAVHHYQILQITLTVFHLDMITPIWGCFFLASTLRSHWKWIGRKETFSEFLTAALYVNRLVKFLSDQWFTRVLLCSSSSVSLRANG